MADGGGWPRVQGYCPMGCGETLFLGEGGHVTCSWVKCPRPDAVDTILGDGETEHIVRLGERDDGFSITHPLRERIDGELHHCALHEWLGRQDGPPVMAGRTYRVYEDDPYYFEAISEEGS